MSETNPRRVDCSVPAPENPRRRLEAIDPTLRLFWIPHGIAPNHGCWGVFELVQVRRGPELDGFPIYTQGHKAHLVMKLCEHGQPLAIDPWDERITARLAHAGHHRHGGKAAFIAHLRAQEDMAEAQRQKTARAASEPLAEHLYEQARRLASEHNLATRPRRTFAEQPTLKRRIFT